MSSSCCRLDIRKLKEFINYASENPTVLNLPHLDFVKKFLESFGGKVPESEFEMPADATATFPFDGDMKVNTDSECSDYVENNDYFIEVESESEPESEIELDMDGVIEPDETAEQPMGDPGKSPTDDEIENAAKFRSLAAAAYNVQKFDEAIKHYTTAIELNPVSSLYLAKRGQVYLKLKKPNACIRDCNKALEINCDSAIAFKFRGRAHRLLGNWELAAKDLRLACNIDFDEEADEWLREVTPNASKIEQHRIKQERRLVERGVRNAERAALRAKKAREAQQAGNTGAGNEAGGSSCDFDDLPFGPDEIRKFLNNPELKVVLKDILSDPSKASRYESNPKVAALIKDLFPDLFPVEEVTETSKINAEKSEDATKDLLVAGLTIEETTSAEKTTHLEGDEVD